MTKKLQPSDDVTSLYWRPQSKHGRMRKELGKKFQKPDEEILQKKRKATEKVGLASSDFTSVRKTKII